MSTRNCERTAIMRAMFVDSRLQRLSRGGSGLDVSWFTSFPREASMFSTSPKQIRGFFTSRCQDYRPGTAQVVASAVRSYLRFRSLRHADQVESLLAAVPSAACWRLAALPQYLEADELALLMAGFDRKLPQQQRDYAIVRCLVDLDSVLARSRHYVWTTSTGRTAY